MRITKYIHSCLLLEEGDTKILVDPGVYLFADGAMMPESLSGLAAVFITHDHPDHADPKALKIILEKNPGIKIYSNSDTERALHASGFSVDVFEVGKKQVGAFAIDAHPADHAKILTPEPKNTAYAFNKQILVTGDSYDGRLSWFKNVPILATPIVAPWTNQLQTAEFVKLLAPKTFLPVHDGYVKDFFQERMSAVFKEHLAGSNIDLHALRIGEHFEI